MFISDLASVVLPGNNMAMELYADDCKSSRIVDPDEDLELLRKDLENLEEWSILNGMEFKWKVMKMTRRRKKQPFTSTFFLNNIELEDDDELRDLCVITDHLLRRTVVFPRQIGSWD